MEECIFCRIAKGDIPSAKVYEDSKVMAFLDITPINRGHTLIIPKEHHKNISDTPKDILAEVITAAKKVAKAAVKATSADGFNIGVNNGKAAGQEIMHFHMHVIPRFEDDGLESWHGKKYEEGEMGRIAENMKSIL